MYDDLKKFIEIKINWQKRDPAAGKKKTVMNGGLDSQVDVSRNFNIRDCFGTLPVMRTMENYIFNQVIPNMNKFLELRLRMNEKYTNLVRNSIRLIAEASKYTGKNNTYIRNINAVYKTFWKIPQLKELTESLKT